MLAGMLNPSYVIMKKTFLYTLSILFEKELKTTKYVNYNKQRNALVACFSVGLLTVIN